MHAFIKGTFCFTYMYVAESGVRDKLDDISRFAVCLLSFTDAPNDDLAIWSGVISLKIYKM